MWKLHAAMRVYVYTKKNIYMYMYMYMYIHTYNCIHVYMNIYIYRYRYREWDALGSTYLQCFMLFLQHFTHDQQAHLNYTFVLCCRWSNSTKVCCSGSLYLSSHSIRVAEGLVPNRITFVIVGQHPLKICELWQGNTHPILCCCCGSMPIQITYL